MATRKVVALHVIVASDPNPEMRFTGRYQDDGEPILEKATYTIQPGSIFEMDEADPDFHPFLQQESIRLATPGEVELGHA